MEFRKITDNKEVVAYTVQTLSTYLENGRVLWLLPGGSSIPLAAAISQQIKPELTAHLTVTLTDERYGVVGHPDSNWKQLIDAGFKFGDAHQLPVLSDKPMAETVKDFSNTLEEALGNVDYRLGFFGMGADGHTAGILPGSPAVNDESFASGYDAGNFMRITMTPKAIGYLDESVIYAAGEAKREALLNLDLEDLPLDIQPAQIHKQVGKSIIFNDQIGDKL